MSMKLNKGKVLPIGVDLGTHSMKIAQLRALPKGKYSLIAAASVEVPREVRKDPSARPRFFWDAFKELLASNPFKGRQCILSLPAEKTFVQHLKLDKMPADQLAGSLMWELQGKLPYDPSRAVIRHIVAGDIFADNVVKQELIVLATSRDVVQMHIDIAKRAKLDCVGINVEPCAIVECFARLFRRAEDVNRTTLFIDIGLSSTQVVISHGPHLAFARNLFMGAALFDRTAAEGLGISLDEARAERLRQSRGEGGGSMERPLHGLLAEPLAKMNEELTSCLRYYDSVFHNRPVERVVFLGGQAHDKKLCQMIAQSLGLPAQIGDPLASIEREPGSDRKIEQAGGQTLPDWAVAVGLSIGAAEHGSAVSAA